MELRNYQKQCIESLVKTDRGYICAPTGSGKTMMMAGIISKLKEPTIVIVPSKLLAEQAKDTFSVVCPDVSIGIIDGYTKDKMGTLNGNDIVVATWQSLSKLDFKQTHHSLVLVDECHRASAKIQSQLIKDLGNIKNNMKIYGFSATPYRTNAEAQNILLSLFNYNLAYKVDIEMLYENNFLMRPSISIIKTPNFSISSLSHERLFNQAIDTSIRLSNKLAERKKTDELILTIDDENNFDEIFDKIFSRSFIGLKNDNFNELGENLTSKDIQSSIDIIKSHYNEKFSNNENRLLQLRIDYNDFLANKNEFLSNENLTNDEVIAFNNLFSSMNIFIKNMLLRTPYYNIANWGRNGKADIGMQIGACKKTIAVNANVNYATRKVIDLKIKESENVKMLILADTINGANNLMEFIKQNYPSKQVIYIDGSIKAQNRKELLEFAKKNNDYIIIATTKTMSEGVDIPNLEKIINTSPLTPPFEQATAIEQALGRVMRLAPNKNANKVEMITFDYQLKDFKNHLNQTLLRLYNKKPSQLFLFENTNKYINKIGKNIKKAIENKIEQDFTTPAKNSLKPF